jgi:hypothetical protein
MRFNLINQDIAIICCRSAPFSSATEEGREASISSLNIHEQLAILKMAAATATGV